MKLRQIDKQEERQMWIRRMAEGAGEEAPKAVVPTYGEVSIDNDETSALILPPKFNTYDKISDKETKYQSTLCQTKIRWSRQTTGGPKEMEEDARDREESGETGEERMEREIWEESSREVFDEINKTLDFRKLKVTDMKDNPRVVLPSPRPPGEEAALTAKEQLWNEAVEDYARKKCNNGRQKSNMTRQEEIGTKKLQERKKRGEIVMVPTDKSGKMSVSTRECYRNQGDIHTKNDRKVTWKEREEAGRTLKGHTKALGKVV